MEALCESQTPTTEPDLQPDGSRWRSVTAEKQPSPEEAGLPVAFLKTG